MKPSIYEVSVPIENQEQADRMLALCKEYNLPHWNDEDAFEYRANLIFEYDEFAFGFYCSIFKTYKPKITEQEFINLLKETR